MKYDLKLLPESKEGSNYLNDVLDLSLNDLLANEIMKLEDEYSGIIQEPIQSIMWYKNGWNWNIYKTDYGNVMTYLPAIAFKSIEFAFLSDFNRKNKAVIAYIKELSDNHKIYLYWENVSFWINT